MEGCNIRGQSFMALVGIKMDSKIKDKLLPSGCSECGPCGFAAYPMVYGGVQKLT